MGITNSNETMQSLIRITDQVNFHYQVGDFGYADDRPEREFETIWDEFMTRIEPFTSREAYMTCPGNHEASCHQFGSVGCRKNFDNFTAYRNRFRMPAPESLSPAGNMWFSFNYSSVHFISISTETDYFYSPEGRGTLWNAGPFGNQLKWLEDDLINANNNRHNQPWIIVIGHRPLYSLVVAQYPPGISADIRATFEDLFIKYNVDMYVCGHVHAYERFYPVYKEKMQQHNYTNPRVPVYLVIGNAGNIEGHQKDFTSSPDYLAFRNDDTYGYGIMEIFNSTTIEWSMFAANDSRLMDSFTLYKEH